MNWYIIVLLISTAQHTASSFSIDKPNIILPAYSSEEDCKTAGVTKTDKLNESDPTHLVSQNKKYVFVCTQL